MTIQYYNIRVPDKSKESQNKLLGGTLGGTSLTALDIALILQYVHNVCNAFVRNTL